MDCAATHGDDIGRVLIAGDTHGNTKWVKHLTDAAARSNCPVIIQVGDFGYFPEHRDGPRFLSMIDRACEANGVELLFIDGNHDDHTSLAELEHGHVPSMSQSTSPISREERASTSVAARSASSVARSPEWERTKPWQMLPSTRAFVVAGGRI